MDHLSEEQLNEYLDNLLDEKARYKVEVHLASCLACRGQLEDLKLVFTALDELLEAPIARDLTPFVLSSLPQKATVRVWTRAFTAQLGMVTGVCFWLAMQAIPLIEAARFSFPKNLIPSLQALFTRLLSIRFAFPDLGLTAWSYQIPPFFELSMLNISLPFSLTNVAALAIPALILWMLGNLILLRRSEGGK